MARSFSITPERIIGLKDGQSWYDSRDYPVQFFPPEEVVLIEDVTISFPDFAKANAYGYAAGLIGGGDPVESCMSVTTLPFQDWGPTDQPGITHTLADTVIGTIPGEADVAVVRVRGVRTNAPDQINSNTPPVAFQEDQWVMADGGTLLMEYLWPIVRMIWIRLAEDLNVDGTRNVILTRKQSVSKVAYAYWAPNNSPNNSGWTYGGTNGRYGHTVRLIESKGPVTAIGGVQRYRRNGPSPCSLTDTSDFASTYVMDVEILPGRSNIEAFNTGGATGLGATIITLGDGDSKNDSAAATHTYTDKFIGTAPEGVNTRHIFVSVSAYIGNQSGNRDLNSVTLDGVAMSLVVKNRGWYNSGTGSDNNALSAIYMLEVTSSDTAADIVLNFSNSFWYSQIDVYAVYNLPPGAPLETLDGNGIGTTNYSLDSSPFGVALLVTSIYRPQNPITTDGLTGIGNVLTEGFMTVSPAVRSMRRDRGWQQLNSSSPLAISVVDTGTGSGKTASHVMASFAGRAGRSYAFTDSIILTPGAGPSFTFPDAYVGDEPETNNTRTVILMVAAGGNTSSFDILSVTIGGVAATQRAKYRLAGGLSYVATIYTLVVPTGTEKNIVINFTGGTGFLAAVDVYAAYNLLSAVPVDIAGAATVGSNSVSDTLSSSPFGFSIGGGVTLNEPTVTGLANSIQEDISGAYHRFRSWKQTDTGETVGVSVVTGGIQAAVWASFA